MGTLEIDPEFKNLIPPLTDEERAQLEESLVKEGCRDSLVVWQETLIDGHNRYEICQKHNLPFKTIEKEFADRSMVMEWIINNQFGRRNLSLYDRGLLALRLKVVYEEIAKKNLSLAGQGLATLPKVKSREDSAKKFKVSDGSLAKIEAIETRAPQNLKDQIRSGEISVNAAYKEVKKEDRKYQNKVDQQSALALLPDQVLWEVKQEISGAVPCQVLITDPPYGILNEPWEPDFLEKFTREWAAEWNNCGADFILTFFSQRYLWDGKKWFDESFSNYQFQQLLIWHYPNNKSPQSKQGFKQTWEPIFFYRRKDSQKQINLDGGDWGDGLNDFDCFVGAVPQSNFNGENMKEHPAQKPVEVMKWLVNATTKPGEIVCDPFMGSGTTGIAATQLFRRFVGIENDPVFYELSRGRLALYGK